MYSSDYGRFEQLQDEDSDLEQQQSGNSWDAELQRRIDQEHIPDDSEGLDELCLDNYLGQQRGVTGDMVETVYSTLIGENDQLRCVEQMGSSCPETIEQCTATRSVAVCGLDTMD